MTMLHIGFTGTRTPLPPEQHAALEGILRGHARAGRCCLHHGDCVGADAAAHAIALALGMWIVLHLPTASRLRSFCKDAHESRTPRPFLDRNKDIVDESSVLLACPAGPEELRSGTWATCRYARKVGRPIVIIWPSGEIAREEAAC
jgi:hypothetical protein